LGKVLSEDVIPSESGKPKVEVAQAIEEARENIEQETKTTRRQSGGESRQRNSNKAARVVREES